MMESRRIKDVLQVSCSDDFAAMLAGARADIYNIICSPNRFFIMLDHDKRIPHIAQVHKGTNQAGVVALMKTDTGLIEDIEHTHKAGADLRRKSDSLCLASGQG